MKRDAIDFHVVAPDHLAIHARLENWALWANGKPSTIVQPMFMLYRPDSFERESSGIVIDRLDAQKVQKAVSALPEKHRQAITWHYVAPCSPVRMARSLGETLDGLAELVRRGRTMLNNRNA